MPKGHGKVVANNKKAYHDYHVEEKLEAGIVLTGTEIKSIRSGAVTIKDSFCSIHKNEVFVEAMHISPYKEGNIFNHDPYRQKKLLLHKKEILKLEQKRKLEGITIIPLSLYLKDGFLKVELGVCRGKNTVDKRQDLKKKDAKREIERHLKNKY